MLAANGLVTVLDCDNINDAFSNREERLCLWFSSCYCKFVVGNWEEEQFTMSWDICLMLFRVWLFLLSGSFFKFQYMADEKAIRKCFTEVSLCPVLWVITDLLLSNRFFIQAARIVQEGSLLLICFAEFLSSIWSHLHLQKQTYWQWNVNSCAQDCCVCV